MSWPVQPGSAGPSGQYRPGSAGSSEPAAPSSEQRRRGGWWIVAIVLITATAVTFGLGLGGNQRWLPGPFSTGTSKAAAPKVPATARSLPLTLSIPAIGLKTPLSELGLNPNGTIEVPTDFQEPGWYRFGPSPGQMGSAVILGHVDSYRGPAVFFRLRSLRPGDHVDVSLADGVTAHFLVRQVAMYSKAHFPTLLVYGTHGYSGLQLVTCGGVFDTQTRSYLSNIVVYTNLIAAS